MSDANWLTSNPPQDGTPFLALLRETQSEYDYVAKEYATTPTVAVWIAPIGKFGCASLHAVEYIPGWERSFRYLPLFNFDPEAIKAWRPMPG